MYYRMFAVYHAVLMMCPFLPILVADSMEQLKKKPCQVAPPAWLRWVPVFGFMIWRYQIAFWVGAYQSRNRLVFPVLSGSEDKFVLAVRGDHWITAPLLPGKRNGRPLTLFKLNNGE